MVESDKKETAATFEAMNSRPRFTANVLPIEILNKIFNDPELAWDGSDSCVPIGEDCPWTTHVRTRRSIPLVCRVWWTAGISLLYRIIHIHHEERLNALVKTLKESKSQQLLLGEIKAGPPEGYGIWVQHIHVHPVISKDWWWAYERDVLDAFDLCPELRTFISRPVWGGGVAPKTNLSIICILDSRKTELPIRKLCAREASILDNLTSLRILVDYDYYLSSNNCFACRRSILLERLESLYCEVQSLCAYESLEIISKWRLPNLRALSLKLAWGQPAILFHDGNRPLRLLCNAFGPKLRYLLLDNHLCDLDIDEAFAYFLIKCSRLETLVFDPSRIGVIDPDDLYAPHTSLRCVKVLWSGLSSARAQSQTLKAHLNAFSKRKVFPALAKFVVGESAFNDLPCRSNWVECLTIDIVSWSRQFQEKGIILVDRGGKPTTYETDTDVLRKQETDEASEYESGRDEDMSSVV